MKKSDKIRKRQKRIDSIRLNLRGSAEKPRLCVFRSLRHIYAQLIDDDNTMTITAASSDNKDVKEQIAGKSKKEVAAIVGKRIAEKAKEKGIEKVVFDRHGYIYHGRVKALADGAREAGLKF